ncbi:PREDICTED: uncharacterized protein LOC108558040 [Nicrophorus vespilloides]|uniref:Uncharacterized protein LOC108558040 n=1 Tax=Nicrophorus vespilloides TaxID=110193 RepID=A0ABM1M6W6_NICVS|nr:PREDICTED: uncharacterized protein LOC108558040 [Nicrophorus vespilloides]
MVKKIHKIVLADHPLKVHELADMVVISKSALYKILTENLDMRNLCKMDAAFAHNQDNWLDLDLSDNEEVQSAVASYFEELHGSDYKQGIQAIEHHWEKCIELKEDFVEI